MWNPFLTGPFIPVPVVSSRESAMRTRPRPVGTCLLAAASLAATAFLPVADEPADASDNMRHVANIPYAGQYGEQDNQGTDLEFADYEFEVESDDGTHPGREHSNGRARIPDHVPDPDGTTTETRTFAFAGSYDNGLHVIDVTDPEQTQVVAVYDCPISQGDVQVFHRGDRTYVTYTHDTGYSFPGDSTSEEDPATCLGEARDLIAQGRLEVGVDDPAETFGTYIVDVTDPYAPTLASFVPVPKGSHNQTVHPSGAYLYNSNSDLIDSVAGERGAGIEVYDITDLGRPFETAFLPLPIRPGLGTESHDLSFSDDGTRAYSAALSQTVIIDTEEPDAPSVISSFVDPAINVEHQADPITIDDPLLGERDFLVVEDEVAGALPTGQCPNGGVHVYDITGELEANPVKVGYWNISDIRPATNDTTGGLVGATNISRCTAHVFELHEDEQLMTIAYYNGGVRVVDLSGLVGVALGTTGVGMQQVAHLRFDDSDTWAVKAPFVDRDGVFHIYGNDQARGFDVYEVDLSDPAATSANAGAWMTPAEIEAVVAELPDPDPDQLRQFSCLLPPSD